MADRTYDYRAAHWTEKYVARSFPRLSASAHHVYAALRFLEEAQNGFCKPVCANYREIARAAHIDKNTVKGALLELAAQGLICLTLGSQLKCDRRATIIKRVSIDEIKARTRDGDEYAQRLAQALTGRSFQYGNRMVCPVWSVSRTGRVTSSKPDVQGEKPGERKRALAEGLPTGYALVHADIKSADPTVSKHILGFPQEADLYAEYMSATGCDKASAKEVLNKLAYCKNTLAVFAHWPQAARDNPVLAAYASRLHEYKLVLLEDARKARCVKTLTGRAIRLEKGERVKPGKAFNWQVQGSVADIVNAAALEMLERPDVKTVVPLHDALYVVIEAARAPEVADRIAEHGRRAGVQLQVKTEVVT